MDKIFSHFVSRSDESNTTRTAYASWFVENFPVTEFKSDERLFWEFMKYCVTLASPIKLKYLDIWSSTELRKILRKDGVRVTGCESLNFNEPVAFETAVRTTQQVLHDDFIVLQSMESPIDDFRIEMAAYMSNKRSQKLTEVLSNTYNMISDTESATDAADFAMQSIGEINTLYDTENLADLQDTVQSIEEGLFEFVSDSGLPAIDTDSMGIHRCQLLGVEAQPGVGKTRFTLGTYCYRAAVLYKKNVLFVEQEQTSVEVRSMLIAKHIFETFNIQISDKMILDGKVPDELQSYVEAARIDLFESGKYGKIEILEEVLAVEKFIPRLSSVDRLKGPFDLVCIDYMGLMESVPDKYQQEKSEYDIIKTGFKLFKRYVRKTRKAGIAISQLNRDGIAAGEADKKITTDMAQGGIAVYRNTDFNIAITMTDTMKAQMKRRFQQPKVRNSNGFGTFISDTRLGFLYFKQQANKEV